MIARLFKWLDKTETRMRRSFGYDITTPSERWKSKLHFQLFDHAFLRTFWHNFHEVAPGVYRSNQPTHARFAKYQSKLGINTILNLRGPDKRAQYLFEVETCENLGLELIDAKLWARKAPERDAIIRVIDILRTAQKPLLFHCKSGADRTGFVAALYLLIFEDASIETAMKQLSLKYIHLDFTATGIQDYILEIFEARQALGSIGFEEWIRTEYDKAPIKAGFADKRFALDVARDMQA